MALVKSTLEQAIKAILDAGVEKTESPEQARADFAADLATAIDTYIKSATVVVNAGQPVQVVFPAGSGVSSAPGSGSLT